MKNTGKTVVSLIIVILLVSIFAGYVAGFIIYKEYREKTKYYDMQAQFTLDKFEKLESNLKDLYSTLSNTVDQNMIVRKKLLSTIKNMNDDIQDWKKGYGATLSDIRDEINDLEIGRLRRMVEKLQDDIDAFKMTIQDLELKDELKGIDLGKISVQKKEKKKKEDKGRQEE